MFTKVLVAEDFDSYSIAVSEALKSLDIIDISHSAYCDDALLKVRKSIADRNQFDLLITDLSFKPDSKPAVISNGLELIKHVCDLQPHIKVIVYSIENRQHLVQQLFHELSIDGFVLKGRNNIPEIKKAVTAAYEGKRYISPDVSHFLTDKSLSEIEEYDLELIRLLAEGKVQAEISEVFRSDNISPSSVSSVEKRINKLKITLGANNNVHLIAIAKDLGLV